MNRGQRCSCLLSLVAGVVLALLCPVVQAYTFSENLSAYAYVQAWATVYEELEEADNVLQNPSGDEGLTQTTGFSLHQVRAGIHYNLPDILEFALLLKLERSPALLNAYVAFPLARWFKLQVGQQKIPTTYEGLVLSSDLDFAHRSLLTRASADYALSRTVHRSSLFYNNRSHYRDLGVALKGELDLGRGGFRYFAMVGNGLGANLYFGGASERQYILTNGPQLFYGMRVELFDWFDVVSLGAHASFNQHDDMVIGSGRAVYDLNRLSYSTDVHIAVPLSGVTISGLVGGGLVDDDYDDNKRVDLRFLGYDLRLVWSMGQAFAGLVPSNLTDEHDLRFTARYDWYRSQWNGLGEDIEQLEVTGGVNYLHRDLIRVMLQVIWRDTKDPGQPDLMDNGVLLSFQARI